MNRRTKFEQALIKNILQSVNTTLPAKVISYDKTKNTVDVEILLTRKTTEGEIVDYQPLSNVVCLIQHGGGYTVKVPYRSGDLVLVGFCQRDIDEVKEYGSKANPRQRMHDINDAFCLGGWVSINQGLGSIEDGLVLKSEGSSKIIMTDDRIDINSNAVFINGNPV